MSVTPASNTAADYALPKEKMREPVKELGKDQFLQLIMTQLQNQDPTSPMEDATYITTMSQLSSLESMATMATSFTQSQTYTMIGKGVIGTLIGENGYKSEIIGTVDSAGIEAGKPYVMVNDKKIWAENISQVFDKSIISGNMQDMLTGSNMVGKYVSADVTQNGETINFVGKVERIELVEGELMVVADGTRLALYQITAIADDAQQLADYVSKGVADSQAAKKAAEEAAAAAASAATAETASGS